MFEYLINGTNLQKALFVMLAGILGVFAVLILFFILIIVLVRVFPEKEEK
ncbi:MAG TPA: hypothetical protein PK733_10695 [Clostridiales bacterium]|nr:hypothetical protein [Clostridiales bacterium]